MWDTMACPECGGTMFYLKGIVDLGMILNYRKKEYWCSKCPHMIVVDKR